MLRKVLLSMSAGLVALTLAAPAGAAQARVKGKFKPELSPLAVPVLGSAKVKPMGNNEHRVGLTLQHVWRADYDVYVGSFVDGNGDGVPQDAELRAPVQVGDCDLSSPTKKGHAGCQGVVTLEGVPYMVMLGVPQNIGAVFEAFAPVK